MQVGGNTSRGPLFPSLFPPFTSTAEIRTAAPRVWRPIAVATNHARRRGSPRGPRMPRPHRVGTASERRLVVSPSCVTAIRTAKRDVDRPCRRTLENGRGDHEASRNAERREPVTRGTGNVFADLGFPDAAERQAKLRLAYALNQVLDGRKLSQADAARVLVGVTVYEVSP